MRCIYYDVSKISKAKKMSKYGLNLQLWLCCGSLISNGVEYDTFQSILRHRVQHHTLGSNIWSLFVL